MLNEYNGTKIEIRNCKTFVEYFYMNMVTYERNGVETIADNDRILWLNEEHVEKELDH